MSRIRIGTRGSTLALWQAQWLMDSLKRASRRASCEVVVIQTQSDRDQRTPLERMGATNVFTREIEQALLAGEIDVAVHSLKDLSSEMPKGLVLAATSPREDARDALVTRDGRGLEDLPRGAVVGTSSLRRRSLLLHARPAARVEPLRGNIETRLRKLEQGDYDAIIMAHAALQRLGLDVPCVTLDPTIWVPAAGQGIIGVQARAGDDELLDLLGRVSNPASMWCAQVERGLLRALGGGCTVPVGAHAIFHRHRKSWRGRAPRERGQPITDDDLVSLYGFVGSPDGRRALYSSAAANEPASDMLVRGIAADLKKQGADDVLALLRGRNSNW